jgi:glyoxylase I family protein
MESLSGLHHIALTVSDLDNSVAWYTDVLGIVEQFRESRPTRNAAVLRATSGAWSVGLVEHVGSPAPAFSPIVTGLDHFAFSVASQDEMRQWARHLDAHRVEHSGPIEIPPGEILNFKDPDGIAVALFWDRAS